MKFSDYLNQYIEILGCSAKELADACELTSAVISRYRTGEREPAPDSDQLEKLVSGTAMLFKSKGMTDMSVQKIRAELVDSLNLKNSAYDNFIKNFDSLISALNINMKALAAASSFDVSYLYRVRSGQRRPSDLNVFCSNLCR